MASAAAPLLDCNLSQLGEKKKERRKKAEERCTCVTLSDWAWKLWKTESAVQGLREVHLRSHLLKLLLILPQYFRAEDPVVPS